MSGTIHVIPRGDLIEHVTAGECPCGPTTESCPQPDGSEATMVIHRALGRWEDGAE